MALTQTRRIAMALAILVASAWPAAAQQHIEGQVGPGSLYALDVPASWNGDLVVYAHGIVDPVMPVALPSAQDNFAVILAALMDRGYAVASSSYSANGFVLKDAAQRTHQLSGIFTSRVSRPNRVYLAGHSLGSMAALQLVETFPGQYDGALLMCGFLGGSTREIAHIATARAAFDYFFPGVVPGSVFSIPPGTDFRPGTPLFLRVQGALVGGFAYPYKTVQLARVAGLAGNNPTEIITSALNVIGFNLRYTPDVLQHTHGHIPFDNQDTVYVGSSDDAALNAGIQRWAGDPDAMNALSHYYDPTGALQVPVQTLHTDRDAVVPVWHEALFADLVRMQGAAELLEQRIVPAYGHCTFTPDQTLVAFDRLVARVTRQ
jgi:pimeloyl-ACP methyl ester carboxylesterase